jgi:hypothetical protein
MFGPSQPGRQRQLHFIIPTFPSFGELVASNAISAHQIAASCAFFEDFPNHTKVIRFTRR